MFQISTKLRFQTNLKINKLQKHNNDQIDLQERKKNGNKTYFMLQNFLKIKKYQRN